MFGQVREKTQVVAHLLASFGGVNDGNHGKPTNRSYQPGITVVTTYSLGWLNMQVGSCYTLSMHVCICNIYIYIYIYVYIYIYICVRACVFLTYIYIYVRRCESYIIIYYTASRKILQVDNCNLPKR